MGKKRKNDFGNELKDKQKLKKQNVNNNVLRERLADIGIFQVFFLFEKFFDPKNLTKFFFCSKFLFSRITVEKRF